MTRYAHRPYAAGLAAAVLVLLGACTTASTSPPQSTVASTSPSSSSVPTTAGGNTGNDSPTSTTSSSTIPTAARVHTEAGAEAFTKYFMAQVNEAYATGSPSRISGNASSTCKSCSLYVDSIESYNKKQLRYVGDFAKADFVTIATFDQSSAKVFVATDTAERSNCQGLWIGVSGDVLIGG